MGWTFDVAELRAEVFRAGDAALSLVNCESSKAAQAAALIGWCAYLAAGTDKLGRSVGKGVRPQTRSDGTGTRGRFIKWSAKVLQ